MADEVKEGVATHATEDVPATDDAREQEQEQEHLTQATVLEGRI